MTRAKEMRDLPLAIDVTASGNVAIDTDTLFVDVSQDNVGINTNSVDSDVALEVNGNVAFKNGSNYSLYADVDGGITFYHNGTNVFNTTANGLNVTGTLTTSGNVGIGDTNPAQTLTLASSIGSNSSTAFASMDGRIGFDTDYSDSARGPNKIVLQNDGNWISGLGISNNYLDIYSGGNIAFHRSTSPNAYTNNMTIQYDGKVGIGTTGPLVKLDLGVTSPGDQVIALRQNGVSRTTLGITTNYGVRVASPSDASATGAMFEVGQNNASDGTTYQNTRFSVLYNGKVGIGTTSPYKKLTLSSAFGGSAEDLLDLQSSSAGGGTAPKIRFGTWANNSNTIGRIGFVDNPNYGGDFVVETNSSGGATDTTTEKFKVDKDGIVTLTNGQTLNSAGATIQTVTATPNTMASGNPVNVWTEINSNYRVQMTSKKGGRILGTYHIPMNPTGASNILMAIQPWYSTNGGTTKNIISQGITSGSRFNLAVSWFRSSNGFDGNDMQNHVVKFYLDGITASTTVVFGWYFRSEGGNTTYFCHSNGNNSLWGWTAPMYLELREIMT